MELVLSLGLCEGRVVVRVKVGVRIIFRFMGGEGGVVVRVKVGFRIILRFMGGEGGG